MDGTENVDASPGWAIRELLKESGVAEWDPRVVNQLLEFQYRTTKNLLEESSNYAKYAGRQALQESDLRLVIQQDQSTVNGPPRDVLTAIATTINRKSLPPVNESHTIRLPKANVCLMADNYQVTVPPTSSKPHQDANAQNAPALTAEQEQEARYNVSRELKKKKKIVSLGTGE